MKGNISDEAGMNYMVPPFLHVTLNPKRKDQISFLLEPKAGVVPRTDKLLCGSRACSAETSSTLFSLKYLDKAGSQVTIRAKMSLLRRVPRYTISFDKINGRNVEVDLAMAQTT